MALSNKERQALHRDRLKAGAAWAVGASAVVERLVDGWMEARRGLAQELAMLESGQMRTSTDHVDNTVETIERVRGYIGNYDALIRQYGFGEKGPRAVHRGRFRVLPLKAESGFIARFEPSGYGPTWDVSKFDTEQEAASWLKAQRTKANDALSRTMLLLAKHKAEPTRALMEALAALNGVNAQFLPEGPGQEYLGRALGWLRKRAAVFTPEPFADLLDEEFYWFYEWVFRAGAERLGP
jgi:hypothetical protein